MCHMSFKGKAMYASFFLAILFGIVIPYIVCHYVTLEDGFCRISFYMGLGFGGLSILLYLVYNLLCVRSRRGGFNCAFAANQHQYPKTIGINKKYNLEYSINC